MLLDPIEQIKQWDSQSSLELCQVTTPQHDIVVRKGHYCPNTVLIISEGDNWWKKFIIITLIMVGLLLEHLETYFYVILQNLYESIALPLREINYKQFHKQT